MAECEANKGQAPGAAPGRKEAPELLWPPASDHQASFRASWPLPSRSACSDCFQPPVSRVTPTQQNKHTGTVRSCFRKIPLVAPLFQFCT